VAVVLAATGKLDAHIFALYGDGCIHEVSRLSWQTMKPKLLLGLALVLSVSLFGCSTTARHSIESRQWSPATNGLQMSLSVLTTGHRDNPEFEVAFRNMGEQDVSLNLGMMLANGSVQLPDKIYLSLMDGSGSNRELHFSDPPVAGRVDDYVVPLRVGSTYTLKLRLDQFVSPDTGDKVKLKPGRYEISARFQGDGATTSNLDMAGMKLMNFWKGKLPSNVVVIVE
jgi:hypothetical protein